MVRVDETLVYICADGLKGSLLCSVEHAQSGTAGSGKNDVGACVCLSQCQFLGSGGIGKGAYIFDNYLHIRVGSLGAGHIPGHEDILGWAVHANHHAYFVGLCVKARNSSHQICFLIVLKQDAGHVVTSCHLAVHEQVSLLRKLGGHLLEGFYGIKAAADDQVVFAGCGEVGKVGFKFRYFLGLHQLILDSVISLGSFHTGQHAVIESAVSQSADADHKGNLERL